MDIKPESPKSRVRAQFNSVAANYDAGPGCFSYFGRRLVEQSGLRPGHHALDVASGRGAALFPAAEIVGPGGAVAGVDLSDQMAFATNVEAARRGVAARVQVMDAEHLDFPNERFDRVLCGFGVMFFPDQPRALAEFRRVLKPSGALCVSTWHVSQTSELDACLRQCGVTQMTPPGWITEPEKLRALLTSAGFGAVQVKVDAHAFRYADVDEYWEQARGTGLRATVDALDPAQRQNVRAALEERVRPHRNADGITLTSSALMATGVR